MTFRSYPTIGALLPFQDFDRFFAETFGATEPLSAWRREGQTAATTPRTDVWEGQDAFELKVELPGVAKEHLQIEVKHRQLAITAEVKKASESEDREASTTRRYERTVQLPLNIETDRIEATLADGLLTVTLPKVAEPKPRTVEIN